MADDDGTARTKIATVVPGQTRFCNLQDLWVFVIFVIFVSIFVETAPSLSITH